MDDETFLHSFLKELLMLLIFLVTCSLVDLSSFSFNFVRSKSYAAFFFTLSEYSLDLIFQRHGFSLYIPINSTQNWRSASVMQLVVSAADMSTVQVAELDWEMRPQGRLMCPHTLKRAWPDAGRTEPTCQRQIREAAQAAWTPHTRSVLPEQSWFVQAAGVCAAP